MQIVVLLNSGLCTIINVSCIGEFVHRAHRKHTFLLDKLKIARNFVCTHTQTFIAKKDQNYQLSV
jgi:hypothetical protein